jgi:O-antigen/teichoic acid export membrane protein
VPALSVRWQPGARANPGHTLTLSGIHLSTTCNQDDDVAVSADAAAVRTPLPKARRQALAGAGLVSAATLGAGLLIYAFHVLAARRLGPEAYGQIAVLWAALFLTVIVLFRPLEQTTSRETANRLARDEEARTVVKAVGRLAAGLLLALGLAIALGWAFITDRLFLGNNAMTAMLLAGIVFYGGAYVTRGLLAGTRWFPGYALGLIADSVVRLLVAAPLVIIASQDLAAAAIAAAGLGGLVVPLAVGRKRLRKAIDAGTDDSSFRLRSALRFAMPLGVVAGADQVLVNGGPLLVMLGGGAGASKAAGVVFAATMLVRVPVYLFQGLAASLLPNLTRLQAVDGAIRFRRAVQHTVLLLFAGGVVIVAGAAVAGPEGMRILYGDDFAAGRLELVLLAAGVAFYLGAATFSQALLALGAAGRAAIAWSVAATLFVALYAIVPGEPLFRIAVAFLGATAGALVGTAATLLRLGAR